MPAAPSAAEPSPSRASRVPRVPRGLARYVLVLCLLAVAAAVVSFVNGSWLGVVWLLLAGLTSNMAWYYARRSRPATGGPAR